MLEVTAIPLRLTGDLLCVILGLMYKSFSLGFPLFGFKIRLPCCTTPCKNEKKLIRGHKPYRGYKGRHDVLPISQNLYSG